MSLSRSEGGNGRILFLIGFMGSGKSWLSRRLSEQGGVPRYDLDEEIEREQGMTIGGYFGRHGEAAFRKTERETLERLCEKIRSVEAKSGDDPHGFAAVVSTGGGTPCFGDNMEWMNANGTTLWIDTPKEVLFERLKRGRAHRPLIRGLDDVGLEAYIASALESRRVFYAKARMHWLGDGKESLDLSKISEHA